MNQYTGIFLAQIFILISIVISAFTENYMVSCIVVPVFSVYTIGWLIRMRYKK